MNPIDPFGSFKGLTKLQSLKIDEILLQGTRRADISRKPYHLLHPEDNLAASLVNLHIYGLEPKNVDLDFMVAKASGLGLECLELSLHMEKTTFSLEPRMTFELTAEQRQTYMEQVELMSARNIELRVWRQGDKFAEKLLFAPGFAVPWPQWKDINKRYWSEADREAYKAHKRARRYCTMSQTT